MFERIWRNYLIELLAQNWVSTEFEVGCLESCLVGSCRPPRHEFSQPLQRACHADWFFPAIFSIISSWKLLISVHDHFVFSPVYFNKEHSSFVLVSYSWSTGRLLLASPEALLLSRSKHASSSEPVLVYSNHCICSPLTSAQHIEIILVLGGPKLDAVFQMWSNMYRVKGNNYRVITVEQLLYWLCYGD